jgi:succinyl-diaminopimelate desuccinylase
MNDLLKKMIAAAPTQDNGEIDAANVLADYFEQHDIPVELDQWDQTRANVIATIGPDTPDTPTLVIGVHLDVVPADKDRWQTDPFTPVEKDGNIYGRGAVDMQGGICAAAAAMVEIAQSNANISKRVIFAATAGEETDSCGIKRFVEQYQSEISNCIGVLIPEPTGMDILRAHRGILWLKVETFGKTAHGSMPHLGINAIEKMNAVLNQLRGFEIPHEKHPLLGDSSMSINRINGGSGTNIVPDSCSVELDIRTLPGQSHEAIIQSIQSILDRLADNDPDFKSSISTLRTVEALETSGSEVFVQSVCAATGISETKAVGFTTDGPFFAKLGAPVVIFGPGDPARCHKPNEYIEIDQLLKGKEMIKSIIAGTIAG